MDILLLFLGLFHSTDVGLFLFVFGAFTFLAFAPFKQ